MYKKDIQISFKDFVFPCKYEPFSICNIEGNCLIFMEVAVEVVFI